MNDTVEISGDVTDAGQPNEQRTVKIELLSQWKLSFAISFEGSPKGGLAVNYPPSLIETRKEPLTTVLLSHPFNWRETNHPVGEFCRWCRVIYCPDFHCSSPPRPIYCLNYHSGPRIIYSTVPDNAGREFPENSQNFLVVMALDSTVIIRHYKQST